MKKINITTAVESSDYDVLTGNAILPETGKYLTGLFPHKSARVLILSNEKVFGLYGADLRESLETADFGTEVWLMPDGEQFKSIETLNDALDYFSEVKLSRSDLVVALGGGVVGDLAGFASAVFLRGIPFVQIPTTLLAMVDSSVGGKTGVNSKHGKNLIGAFHHPRMVIADIALLQTLEIRELKAGFYELIKHGAIGGEELLHKTSGFIEKYPLDDFRDFGGDVEFQNSLAELVAVQIGQKAKVVSDDSREDPARLDSNSRKILNFGHTIGHALEKVTGYSYFRHGEAVGYGMLAAMEIAKRLEFCDSNSINLLNDVVRSVGSLPDAGMIDIDSVVSAIAYDKKASGSEVQWVLLKSIGKPAIVSSEQIPAAVVRDAISAIILA